MGNIQPVALFVIGGVLFVLGFASGFPANLGLALIAGIAIGIGLERQGISNK